MVSNWVELSIRIRTFPSTALVALALAFSVVHTHAETTLFSAQYEGEYSGWNIKMLRTLTTDEAGRYTLRSEASNLFAVIKETSVFNLNETGIEPLHYEYFRKVFGRKKTEALVFNYTDHKAQYLKNNELAHTHTLDSFVSDPGLYQLLLQLQFQIDQPIATFEFLKRNSRKQYQFKYIGADTLTIGKKQYAAKVVERATDSNRTKIWLVPALNFAIGKLEHAEDDDDTNILMLTKYQAETEKLQTFFAKAQKQLTPTPSATPPPKYLKAK